MKARFSEYLTGIADDMKKLVDILSEDFDYVSILSTDSTGFTVTAGQHVVAVTNSTMTTERGNVIRVYKDGLYSEYAFNEYEGDADKVAADAMSFFARQFDVLKATATAIYDTKKLSDEPCTLFVEYEAESLPEETDQEKLIEHLAEISNQAMLLGEDLIECQVRAQSTHISKMFLTKNRDMRQSYVYSEGTIVPIASKNGKTVNSYSGVSGRCGSELFSQLDARLGEVVSTVTELSSSQRIAPGEYEVITSPEVTGLIAHEAFGHGVEMDMFVKNRALGAQYIEKRVGSDLVTMHEGANCAVDVTSYAFDDEGTLAGDVIEIDHGILKTGICDALSALRLGTLPTGNGKRENFEHKVYTRMTNTIFDSGDDELDDMIASIRCGFLLKGMESGMEDPKHWGIQCIIERGYEIVDGRLTGKVVSPVVMTGYVPDLLGNISMVSKDREVFGNGGCGKGHKEWVKVADGGPYLKTKARLG